MQAALQPSDHDQRSRVIPLDVPNAADRPLISARGVVNLASYQTAAAPNTLISVFGRSLATTDIAAATPLPLQLGGVCVTVGSVSAPLFATSPSQINAEVPPDLAAGNYPVVVRSIDKK